MESILNNNPELKHQIEQVAEVAGYLWQKGWAERNGGNIVINITDQFNSQYVRLPQCDSPTTN